MRNLILAAAALALPACGGNISGTYKGTENVKQNGVASTQVITLTLVQSGGDVTGTYSSDKGATGTFSATLDGDTLKNAAIEDTSATCPGTYTGTATVRAGRLLGSVSGTAKCGVSVSGDLDLSLQ